MKIVCEIPLNVRRFDQSQFGWTMRQPPSKQSGGRYETGDMFVLEEAKRLRLFRLEDGHPRSSARELQSASLAEPRACTHFSWNRHSTVLAIAVDKRQIYFWHLATNTFSQFRWASQSEAGGEALPAGANQPANLRRLQVDLVAWSRRTDRLAVCYSSGQILLCKLSISPSSCPITESRFVDNSEGVLKQIVSIEVSESADLFACISVISELLVMTFDGQTKFYVQCDGLTLCRCKFSPANAGRMPGTSSAKPHIWLAYQSRADGLVLKRISLASQDDNDDDDDDDDQGEQLQASDFRDSPRRPELSIAHEVAPAEPPSNLIGFHWLDWQTLVACSSSGSVHVLRLTDAGHGQGAAEQATQESLRKLLAGDDQQRAQRPHSSFQVSEADKFSIANHWAESSLSSPTTDAQTRALVSGNFKLTECRRQPAGRDRSAGRVFGLIVATSSQLFFHQLHESNQIRADSRGRHFRLEQVDQLDLSASLGRVQMQIEALDWNADCSLLAVQLTSGHVLVCRTRLEHQLIASCNSKAAFTTSPNEITVLNYGQNQTGRRDVLSPQADEDGSAQLEANQDEDSSESAAGTGSQEALILSVNFKPSALAIGRRHLALALNNRIRFYSLAEGGHWEAPCEQEFLAIISELSLNGHFVGVLFDDGRLKLQTIPTAARQQPGSATNRDLDNERFFPDPLRPETISCFLLTEDLLVYCTSERCIVQFSLVNWQVVRVCDYRAARGAPTQPIKRLSVNEFGNKFVCISEDEDDESGEQPAPCTSNAHLFDLNTNALLPISSSDGFELVDRFVQCQLDEVTALVPDRFGQIRLNGCRAPLAQLGKLRRPPGRIQDAIWDSDGRTVLLIESEFVHSMAVLDHTLDGEQPVVCHVATASKPTNYRILYASQGIVSYQTILGRMINAILESHNDELRLSQLEESIGRVRESSSALAICDHEDEPNEDALVGVWLRAQFGCQLLKLNYLSSMLPICSLARAHEICLHLANDQQFNIIDEQLELSSGQYRHGLHLINGLVWRLLGVWSIYCSNLSFAQMIFREHKLQAQARLLSQLIASLNRYSKDQLKSRLLELFAYAAGKKIV